MARNGAHGPCPEAGGTLLTPSFDHPAVLLLLAACVLPLIGWGSRWLGFASLLDIPPDPASHLLDAALRVLAALPLAFIVLGLAGLHTGQQTMQRTGTGAHVVVALDRSLSMDEPFASRGERVEQGPHADHARESKTVAAARLLAAFYARRPHDRFGLIAFSTAPIPAMPLTDHRAAVSAAIAAMGGKALANTEIGLGIAMGLTQFDGDQPGAARVLLLISDGAGAIPEQTRRFIRDAIGRTQAHLYYLYLRSGDDPPLTETADESADLTRPAGLDSFFRSLGAPYEAFEARDAGAVDTATRRIGALETHEITYSEMVPRRDLEAVCNGAAAALLLLSLLAQLAERGLTPHRARA